MKKTLLALAFAFALPLAAFAQAPPVTSVEITFFRTGQTVPAVAPQQFPLVNWTCGQPTITDPGTVVNPTTLRVTDPNLSTAECTLTNAQVAAFLSMLGFDPTTTYYGKAKYINSNGLGPESPNSNPFSQPGTVPTVAPARLRLTRGQ